MTSYVEFVAWSLKFRRFRQRKVPYLTDDVEKKGIYVEVKRLVIQKEFGEEAQTLAVVLNFARRFKEREN